MDFGAAVNSVSKALYFELSVFRHSISSIEATNTSVCVFVRELSLAVYAMHELSFRHIFNKTYHLR